MQNQKKKYKLLLKSGLMLLSSLVIVSCAHGFGKKRPEPVIEWCKAYEDGSWECLKKDGNYQTREPEEMLDYVALPIDDAEVYRKYCVRRKDSQ